MQVALKCADLGHLASVDRVHRKWVAALEEEMFRQGDLEKARGHPSVSPLMDRDKGGITRSQPGVSSHDEIVGNVFIGWCFIIA